MKAFTCSILFIFLGLSVTGQTLTNYSNIELASNDVKLFLYSNGNFLNSSLADKGVLRFINPDNELTLLSGSSTGKITFRNAANLNDKWFEFTESQSFFKGKIGIGTTVPKSKLDISFLSPEGGLRIRSGNPNASFTNSQIVFSYNGNATYSHTIKSRHNGGNVKRNALDFFVWQPGDDVNGIGTRHVMSLNGGDVGIGTTSPKSKLDVDGRITLGKRSGDTNNDISSSSLDWFAGYLTRARIKAINAEWYNGKKAITFNLHTTNDNDFSDTEVMRISPLNGGTVGIGTDDPKNKLSVNGTIWAKKVKVTLTDAADWVFEEDYKLRSLEEVEAFITEHKHLPDIPSAEEFRQNDMDVAEMNNKLLQKVEELTLYLIDQNKNIQKQQEDIEVLKAENQHLKKLIQQNQDNR
ncbi:MAG: hypothetical protein AAGI07_09970 [Bacteroidota bacterium]